MGFSVSKHTHTIETQTPKISNQASQGSQATGTQTQAQASADAPTSKSPTQTSQDTQTTKLPSPVNPESQTPKIKLGNTTVESSTLTTNTRILHQGTLFN